MVRQIDSLDLPGSGAAEAYGFEIHGNHPITEVLSYPGSHVTDRTETEHGNRAAVGNPGVLHRLPRGREDIREKDKAIVRRSVGYLDMRCLSHRHAKIFSLTARDLAVQLRESEQGGPGPLFTDLSCLTLAEELLVAHEAMPTRHLEGDNHAVAGLKGCNLTADLFDNSDGLVAHDVTLTHERSQSFVEVEIRTADIGARDLDDRVRGLLDFGIRDSVNADRSLCLPGDCSHRAPPLGRRSVPRPRVLYPHMGFRISVLRRGTERKSSVTKSGC